VNELKEILSNLLSAAEAAKAAAKDKPYEDAVEDFTLAAKAHSRDAHNYMEEGNLEKALAATRYAAKYSFWAVDALRA
jgi:hypothetical protein